MKKICFISYNKDDNTNSEDNSNINKLEKSQPNIEKINEKRKIDQIEDTNNANTTKKIKIESESELEDSKREDIKKNDNSEKHIENKKEDKLIDIINCNDDDDDDCLLSLGPTSESDLNQRYDMFCNG